MPINRYTTPVISSITPLTDSVGVICGGRGNGVGALPAEEMPFVVVLLGPVVTGRRVEATENVEAEIPEAVADVEMLLSESDGVLVTGSFALLDESCDGEVTVLEAEVGCESDVKVGKAEMLVACLI